MNLLKRKLISEMLENWYVADHILFGGIPECYMKKEVFESYLQLKKNYFETLFEMYNLIGYTTKYIDRPKSSNEIQFNALKTVRESRQLASRTMVTEAKHFGKLLKESKKTNLASNVKKLQLSCQFESAFIDSQFKSARRLNNMNDPKFVLLKNCLNECKKELINLSIKYMK